MPNLFDVSFSVRLTTPACPVKDVFQTDCVRLAEQLPFIGRATVTMTAASPQQNSDAGALGGIAAIVAVASCKGGVGKSTTAVNLAFTLQAKGAKVGIMDTDIYGPSLPTLVEPEERQVQFRDGKIKPLEAFGVKLMSFGYVNDDSAIMRGPMIANVVNQLLTTTDWGQLDYLIIDMPPGTGDVQLTLSQIVNITAAVIVTTPQRLAFVDVVKGIDMFDKVNVPSIAVVENMSYFVPPESGVKHYLFGKGHKDRLVKDYGLLNAFSMPIEPEVAESGDSGIPFVVKQPESDVSIQYVELANAVVKEVAKVRFGGLGVPEVRFDETSGFMIAQVENEEEQKIWPADLRRLCRCALCVDEMTGKVLLDPDSVPEDTRPKSMRKVGNYALEVIWPDGHESLYPYSRFVDAYGKQCTEQKDNAQQGDQVSVDTVERERSMA